MLILDTINRKIEIVLAGAITTNQLPFTASYVDITPTTFTGDTNDGTSNSTTPVTMVAAPASSTQRQLKFVNIYNADTVAANVTVRLNDNGTTYVLVKETLQPGYTLQFIDSAGWSVLPFSMAASWSPCGSNSLVSRKWLSAGVGIRRSGSCRMPRRTPSTRIMEWVCFS